MLAAGAFPLSQQAGVNSLIRNKRRTLVAVAAGLMVAGCAAPPTPPATPSTSSVPRSVAPAAPPGGAQPAQTLSEVEWRRALAQHILTVNRERVFEGRPPDPLKAVVVLDLTVGADGRIQHASVLRAPDHARDLGSVALRTAQAASPVPPPPRALLGRGTTVRFTETWLFRQDNRFQLRTLAQTQLIQ